MKKIALTALAAAAAMTAVAAPAAAQPYGYDHDRYDRYDGYDRHDRYVSGWRYERDWDRGFRINQMQRELDRRIDRGVRRGDLTRGEAYQMRRQFDEILRIEARYRYNGLNRWERRDLERRLIAFETRLDRNLRDGQYAYRR
jgi:opacity protein-like surface antigen